jgi:hypothetical protein
MNIRYYTIEGRVCLGYEFKGVIYVMQWLGKHGDCIDVTGRGYTKWH